MSITNSLWEIQQKLKVPKNQNNSFGGYKYRSCEDILEAAKKTLPDGMTLTLTDEIVNVGNANYIKATATISNGKETVSATGWARESVSKKGMDDSQITGSTSSYARKYALNGLFCIDDTKDADSDAHTKERQKADKEEAEAKERKRKLAVLLGQLKALKTYEEVIEFSRSKETMALVKDMSEEQAEWWNKELVAAQSRTSESPVGVQ